MHKHKFTSENLVPTKWNSAENKAKWLNQLADFVRSDFKESKFTKALYNRLSLTFGHIAHYNQYGFYGTWFEDAGKRLNWLYYIQEQMCYGDPEWTWSDAEKQFLAWLKSEEGNFYIRRAMEAHNTELRASAKAQIANATAVLEKLDGPQ